MPTLFWLCLLGCPAQDPETDTQTTDTDTDTDTTEAEPGVVVLAGGGREGDIDDTNAWSWGLYGALLEGGDVTGDGEVHVAVLSTGEETDWLPRYFVTLGADEAHNLQFDGSVLDPATADLSTYDAAFLKGGDQGEYYDLWNDTALEQTLLDLHARGGGLGGTSAGAMSLAGVALAGGQDLVSLDVLTDAQTSWLDDADGGSALHDDFLGVVEGFVIDTHFTERGRLGRLAGALARAVDEVDPDLRGLGLEQQTGVVLRDGVAEVWGDGSVTLLTPGDSTPERIAGSPLHWEGLRLDRWVHAYTIELSTNDVVQRPTGVVDVVPIERDGAFEGPWAADGDAPEHEERFAWVIERTPYSTRIGTESPPLLHAVGALDAHDRDNRAPAHAFLFRGLTDYIGDIGVIVPYGSSLEALEAAPSRLVNADNPYVDDEEVAAVLVLDTYTVTHAGVSARFAPSVDGIQTGALEGLTLHVLGEDQAFEMATD